MYNARPCEKKLLALFLKLTLSWLCHACPLGKYISNQTTHACATCPHGKYTNETNQTSCNSWSSIVNCSEPLHFYKRTAVADNTCEKCPAGKYAPNREKSFCDWIVDPACLPGQEWVLGYPQCKNCANGKYSLGGNMSCTAHLSRCPAGSFRLFAGTGTEDAACAHCPTGRYRPSASMSDAVCTLHSACTNETLDAGTNTQNVVCGQCSGTGMKFHNGQCVKVPTCPPGARLSNDLQCVPCRVGYFQNKSSTAIMSYCPFAWKNCPDRLMEYADFGTTTYDAKCQECPKRSFFSQKAQACVPWTNCYIIYEYVSRNGTILNDRECTKCEGDAASTMGNSLSCDSTLEAVCRKMRGVDCTKQIEFPLVPDRLLSLELLPTAILFILAMLLFSCLGICIINGTQSKAVDDDTYEDLGNDDGMEKVTKKGKFSHHHDLLSELLHFASHFSKDAAHIASAREARLQAKEAKKKAEMIQKKRQEKAQLLKDKKKVARKKSMDRFSHLETDRDDDDHTQLLEPPSSENQGQVDAIAAASHDEVPSEKIADETPASSVVDISDLQQADGASSAVDVSLNGNQVLLPSTPKSAVARGTDQFMLPNQQPTTPQSAVARNNDQFMLPNQPITPQSAVARNTDQFMLPNQPASVAEEEDVADEDHLIL